MKILSVHNRYQNRGGEDSVFEDEKKLLQSRGHTVVEYVRSNDDIKSQNLFLTSIQTIWNQQSYQDIQQEIDLEKPDIIHVHNFFPLVSPAIFYAARSKKIPIVQTLHNYRFWCLNAYFFRDGAICEDCHGKRFMTPGILHKCYRDSTAASAVSAMMLSTHRALSTWDKVNVFIALSKFTYNKFVEYGIPAHKLRIKPNFVHPVPPMGSGADDSVLYVGRLSPEKGIDKLLSAWLHLGKRIKLKIVGTGPLQPEVQSVANQNLGVEYLGQQPIAQVYQLLGQAKALIFPSLWYEAMPRIIIESFSTGTPVIASRLGVMKAMVEPGRTGLHFQPGDVEDLIKQVNWMIEHLDEWQTMRRYARQEFEANYTADCNYDLLMDIYQQAMAQ